MFEQLRQHLGPAVLENESLASHVTFHLGGVAKYFYPASTSDQLLKAVQTAEVLHVPYLVLGLGSNVIVSDQGYDGLVIQVIGGEIHFNQTEVVVDAGAELLALVRQCSAAGLAGIERLAGIPSTVGGAVRGNAGAYGQAISDVVTCVRVYANGAVTEVSKNDMQFGYRDSMLKHQPGVILSVTLSLTTGDAAQLNAINDDTLHKRSRFPTEPSAGCIFKNIELSKTQVDKERVKRVLDLTEDEYVEATKYGKLSVGFIFDRLQYGGRALGGVQMSEKHCAYMINTGTGRAEHAIMLISEMKMRVRNELGIQLQEEVQYVGF